jgi:F420-dependent oxidoreductase-like protein
MAAVAGLAAGAAASRPENLPGRLASRASLPIPVDRLDPTTRTARHRTGDLVEFGLHIADFTWDGGAAELGPQLADHARSAEDAGITRLTVMDHFWQIGAIGVPERAMLEAYTTLGFLAAHTRTALLHTLVTGVIYREPGLVAKQISTLDVLSGGRAGLGIGAAWNADESAGLGFPFPSTAERFERLEEAIQICLHMWSPSEAAFEGKHYQLRRALNSPQNLSAPRPYVMIGGGGERKTLRLVAKYADACNLFGGPDAARKLDVLRSHCEAVGRDYAEIEKTVMISIDPSTTRDGLLRTVSALDKTGFTVTYVFAKDISERAKIIDLLGPVVAELA